MYNKIKNDNLKVKLIAYLLIISAMCGFVVADGPFVWNGLGDGTSWDDALNWDREEVPHEGDGISGSDYRPEIHIMTDGASVLIDSDVPDIHGHIKTWASSGATLQILDGADLVSRGSVYIGDSTSNSPGHLQMTGGSLSVGVWGGRDLRIDNGTFEFGSDNPATAPIFDNSSRNFAMGINYPAEATFSGYGTFRTIAGANIGLNGYYDRTINIVGGNMTLDFAYGGGTFVINLYGQGNSIIHYTLDDTGVSTINVGGDVQFGNNSFLNITVDDSYNANIGDEFTIIDASGAFTGNGTFSNLADGAMLIIDGYVFRANYNTDIDGSTLTIKLVDTGYQEPETTDFYWTGLGDDISWNDAANWNWLQVPYGTGSAYRPNIYVDKDGAVVRIDSDGVDNYGNNYISAEKSAGGATLEIVDGADFICAGLFFGDQTYNSTKEGHLRMTGGNVEVAQYGSRDIRIGYGSMEFGSDNPATAPVLVNNSRAFSIGNGTNGDATFSGYGTFSFVGDAILGGYRTYQRNINVIGGNLTLDFATGGGLSSLSPGIVYISRYNQGITSINYTFNDSGASTIYCGGDVYFGTGSRFELSVCDSFAGSVNDVFTIIDAAGSFTGNGKFDNVENNDIITAGRYSFRANYTTDSGSKFTLTVISALDIYEFNTTSGNFVKNGEVIGTADFVNNAAVFKFDSLNLSSSDMVSIAGIRPIIIEATTGDIVIDTIIDVSGSESIGPEGAAGTLGGYSGGTVPSGFDMPGEQGHGPGGGEGGGQASSVSNGYGGAGAGYGGYGGDGRTSGGGVPYGDETISLFTGGSGGGAGGRGATDVYERQGGGGAGGGAILLKAAGNITVSANGGVISNGGNGWYTTPYGTLPEGTTIRHGGGGSGGSIIFASSSAIVVDANAQIQAVGGVGGSRWDSTACHVSSMSGGGGAGGRIAFYAPSLTIAGQSQSYGSIGEVASVTVAGGEEGTSPYADPDTGEFTRDGQPGSPGSVYFGNTLPELEIPEVGNLYLYEGFDYSVGKLSGQSGYGWDGAWKLPNDPNSAVVAGSLETTFFNLASHSANSFYMEQEVATRKMAYPINLALTETLYISTLTKSTNAANVYPQLAFTSDESSAAAFGWGVDENGFYLLGLDGSTKVQTGVLPVDNTVYMVVLKLDSVAGANTSISMNVYGPGDAVTDEPLWQASDSASSDLVANYMTLYAQNATNQNNLAAFDEIRIADSWTVISGMPTECGDEGTILYTDINGDCVVDLADFAFMGSQWLMSTDPADPEAVRLGYEDGTASTTQNNVIFENSITVDGDISEWDDAQWFSIGVEGIASPDITDAQYAVAWDSAQPDTIYIAAKVRDTDHNFASSIGTWNAGDMLEMRIEGTGAGIDDTSWWDNQNIAQMYRVAYNGSGGSWASWGVNTLEPVTNPDAGLSYAAAIDPSDTAVIIYEAAIKVYDYFGGFDSGTTTLRSLSHNDSIRLDFQVNTVYSGGAGAMKTHQEAAYNNPSTWLQFAAFENSQLQCGDFGYLDADVVENCQVGLADLNELAFTWMLCTDPADESCLKIWLP